MPCHATTTTTTTTTAMATTTATRHLPCAEPSPPHIRPVCSVSPLDPYQCLRLCLCMSLHSGAPAWGCGCTQGAHPCLRTHVSALVICWRKQVWGPPSAARARGRGAANNPTWQLFTPAWHVPLWSNDFLAIRSLQFHSFIEHTPAINLDWCE